LIGDYAADCDADCAKLNHQLDHRKVEEKETTSDLLLLSMNVHLEQMEVWMLEVESVESVVVYERI
jgi:hypothetical protein